MVYGRTKGTILADANTAVRITDLPTCGQEHFTTIHENVSTWPTGASQIQNQILSL